jgi:hypothetical protein
MSASKNTGVSNRNNFYLFCCDVLARRVASPFYAFQVEESSGRLALVSHCDSRTILTYIRFCPFCGATLSPVGDLIFLCNADRADCDKLFSAVEEHVSFDAIVNSIDALFIESQSSYPWVRSVVSTSWPGLMIEVRLMYSKSIWISLTPNLPEYRYFRSVQSSREAGDGPE